MTFSSISTESTTTHQPAYQPVGGDQANHGGVLENQDPMALASQQSALQPAGDNSIVLSTPQLSLQGEALSTVNRQGDQSNTQLQPSPAVDQPSQLSTTALRDGRFLEQLLLHPEKIPQGDQRALRQHLQQRLSSTTAVLSSNHAVSPGEGDPLLATPLADADDTLRINPHLQQQLEQKQAETVENRWPPLAVVMPDDPAKRSAAPPSAWGTSALAQLLQAVERGTEVDQHGLRQLARQLLSANESNNPLAPHQTLVLVTLLLDADNEQTPAGQKLNPRLRRQLLQQLLPLLQRRREGEGAATTATKGQQSAPTARAQLPLPQAVRQAMMTGSRGADGWEEQAPQPPLSTALLWPGVPSMALVAVSEAQINPLLGALVDKGSLPVSSGGSLSQLIGRASMEQLMMVLTTLIMKVNTTSAQSLFASQQINQKATETVTAQQLDKQVEEAKKALEQQESAKKAGILGTIFSWVAAAVTTVAAVVTMNPVLMVAAVLLVTSAAMDTAVLAMGKDAPECLQWISMGLSIVAGLLSGGATLLASVGKTVVKEGMKAALKQIFKAMSDTCKKLLEWFKKLPTATKDFANQALEFVKHPKNALQGVATQAKDKFTKVCTDPKKTAETIKDVTLGAGGVVEAMGQGVAAYYGYQSGMIQAALKTLQNDNWFLQMILEYYQKQKNQLHQAVTDLYQQQGESVEIASQAIQESATLQGRIAGSLI